MECIFIATCIQLYCMNAFMYVCMYECMNVCASYHVTVLNHRNI